MNIQNINISETLKRARQYTEDNNLSSGAKEMFSLLILVIELLVSKFGANSKNSSKPPSQDPFRKKKEKGQSQRKLGGQKGHEGVTLSQVSNPDTVVELTINRDILPADRQYRSLEAICRQVFDIHVSVHVTEYRSEVLVDQNGTKYYADFPEGINSPVQYGSSVKSAAVYLSNFQMIPFERASDLFEHQAGLPISSGTLCNINQEAFTKLEQFEAMVKEKLLQEPVLHSDETGININGKTAWLHTASTEKWTLYAVETKRGQAGMDAIGVLSNYTGILVHDHWQPYFSYKCEHAMCNAHLLRELQRSIDDENQQWAKKMKTLLLNINEECLQKGGSLNSEESFIRNREFEEIIQNGLTECPLATSPPDAVKKRGKIKQTKSRNLLDRLREYQSETLRFMRDPRVPFTNNLAERDIRMTKVHQKISGCFRSSDGAKHFCRIRSFISTCLKQGIDVSSALCGLFQGKLPEFRF